MTSGPCRQSVILFLPHNVSPKRLNDDMFS